MSMVCGLDSHRGQITFDTLEEDSGEVCKTGCGSQAGTGCAAGWRRTWLRELAAPTW